MTLLAEQRRTLSPMDRALHWYVPVVSVEPVALVK